MAEAEAKVPGGKLACVTYERREGFIRVILSGDFFIHPEEGVHLIEKELSSLPEEAPTSLIRKAIDETLASNGIRMYGVDRDTIVSLYEDARSLESHRAYRE